MATRPITNILPTPLPFEDKSRNGQTPDWSLPTNIATRLQFALRNQRKLVFCWSHNLLFNFGSYIDYTTTGARIPWRWQCRTGENVESGSTISLVAVAQILPPSSMTSAGAGDPKWRFAAGGNVSSYYRCPAAVPNPEYRDIHLQVNTLTGLSADTEYNCYVETDGFANILTLMVYEVPELIDGVDLSHTTAVLDSTPYGIQREISETQHTNLYSVPYLLYRHNHAHGFNMVRNDNSGTSFWTRSTNSWANLLDQSASTTVSANTPGVNMQLQYHAPKHKDTVTCVFAAYGSNASTAGGDIKLVDSSGDVSGSTLSSFSTAGEWKNATVEIDASGDLTKLDVQFQSDASANTFTVEAVSLYPYTT